jgi:REP element-mobilizing transposase RayT
LTPRPPRPTQFRLHHITTRGNNRRSMFEDHQDREQFYDLLQVGVAANGVDCHQDVQMGNHVHLLLEGAMTDVSKLLWFVSHRYALAYNARHGRINHLLGRRFHCSGVPDAYAARAVCVYIAMNPVRAGLCEHPQDWAFGSYRSHAIGEMPRPHLDSVFTRDLFAARGTTLAAAVETAIAREQGGRPSLAAILPPPLLLTRAHILHARQLYGYTIPEVAAHYGCPARAIAGMARY